MKRLLVIPARMGSTRFPGKPLVSLAGKPMIQWVFEAAQASGACEDILVATPDEEIASACRSFGARVELTSFSHPSGTDRLAEVARRIRADFYVNVQGDEPLVEPRAIRACAEAAEGADVGSVCVPCRPDGFESPDVVKVVLNRRDEALYFSRAPIPFAREPGGEPPLRHLGLYAYTREALLAFSELSPTPLEQTEKLEQLRFLESGFRIRMARLEPGEREEFGVSVDTPELAEQAHLALLKRWTPHETS